jgi:hypothetical protein
LRPAQQGTFDGLCGVYAIINALDLVGLKRPRDRLHYQLFGQLTHSLGAVALLSGMKEGLTAGDLVSAANDAFRWLNRAHGVSLKLTQPYRLNDYPTVKRFLAMVHEHCHSADSAVVLSIQTPRMSHWTIPYAIEGELMLLRDSGGRSSLNVSKYNLSQGPYLFRVRETLVLRRRGH